MLRGPRGRAEGGMKPIEGRCMIPRLAALLAVLLMAACSSSPPTAQLHSFSQAYQSANDAGQPLLDDLSIAEKSEWRINAANAAGQPNLNDSIPPENPAASCARSDLAWQRVGPGTGFIQGYCVGDAAYYASLGDPPATLAFRGGLAVIGRYVDVLTALAEGRNLEELHGQLQSLSSSISQLLTFLPVGGAAGPAFSGALAALKPLIDQAAQQANNEEIRRLVLAGAPKAQDLIEALKAATPAMFNTLTVLKSISSRSNAPTTLGTVFKRIFEDTFRCCGTASPFFSNWIFLPAHSV